MVIADILKRWQVLLGNTDAQLLTGTDEHGMKVPEILDGHIQGWGWLTPFLDSTSCTGGWNGYPSFL